MTYQKRLPLLIFVDSLIVVTAFIISIFLLHHYIELILFFATLAILLICYHTFSFTYKLYKKAWEYASIGEVQMIIKTAVISIMITGVMQLALFQQLHFRLLFITCLLQIALIGGSRLSWRMMRDKILNQKRTKKNALIVGAGAAGTMIARQLKNNSESGLDPVAFIDDDINKQKLDIFNIPVIGGTQQIKSAAQMYNADMIIIAIPSLKRTELNNIYLECAKTKVKTQILPMIEDLVTGKVSVNQFREVEVEDLLGRDPVELEFEAISESITNKVVLVTGAGGSIGSEICRQISEFKPKTLILLGHGENSIYSIEMELRETFGFNSMKLVTEIADIQDYEKIMTVFNDHKPHVVYHAAAHKHVPLMERNPEEALKNNVIGTMNVAKAASLNDVETFVMVSSDKAVNPTSVMGATKRLAEMVIQYMDTGSKTKFTVVRFGNVLGSRGSVIPLFKKQIQKGGPITITHPEMVRYFMTIPEASKLVIQAGSLAKGGEIFVLDMGEPVKILDLAKNLIKLSGHSVEEIGIQYTGMRRGEKLYEELLNANEIHDQQIYPKIYIGKSSSILIEEITELIASYSLFNKSALSKRIVQLANKGITENEKNGAVLSV